jgi:hypothetical protein
VRLAETSYPADAHDYASDAEELERVDAAMNGAPSGAVVISAISVGLLMIAWLIIYAFVFIPRGTVG